MPPKLDLAPKRIFMPDHDRSLDLLGTKPIAEAINTTTTAVTSGAGAFLSRICLPVAEEFGLLLQDKVRAWRSRNAEEIAQRASLMVDKLPNSELRRAHPRIVGAILSSGSWSDDPDIHSMWAGLLATACTMSGRSQENLIYVNLLTQLTSSEARIIRFACERVTKKKSPTGLLLSDLLEVTVEDIMTASGTEDLHVLDLEVDHLREIGLLSPDSGLSPYESYKPRLTPSTIALQLYVRCSGYIGSPLDYFEL